MSYITNTIISIGMNDSDKLNEVNKYFGEDRGFVSCDSAGLPRGWYGGSKFLEVEIGIGAFNYLNVNLLKEHIKNIQWEYPEDVQLLICDQDTDRFKIWNLID